MPGRPVRPRRRDLARGGNRAGAAPCTCLCPKGSHMAVAPAGERAGGCLSPGCGCIRYRADEDRE